MKEPTERIKRKQREVENKEEQARKDRLQAWRERMKQDMTEVSKLLKKIRDPAIMPSLTWKGKRTETLHEAVEAIRTHWQEVWEPQSREGTRGRKQKGQRM